MTQSNNIVKIFSLRLRAFAFVIFFFNVSFSQVPVIKKDSTVIYESIQSYSKRRPLTAILYKLIFKPVAVVSNKKVTKKRVYAKLIQKPYSSFEGKIIRHIVIETLDPFGYSVTDTARTNKNWMIRSANKIHIQTQRIAIRNLLLIRSNQPFDSLLVKESERLVRTQNYVRNVAFTVKSTSRKSDSVDIFIRELDAWSIYPNFSGSTSVFMFNIIDKNIVGLGHEFQNELSWHHTSSDFAYNTNYFIPNIRNTYINSTLHYGNDVNGNFIKTFAVDRPFFSPYARWAAGVNFSQQFIRDSFPSYNSVVVLQPFKFNSQDYWVGNAIQIFKGNTENNRTTNFITTARFFRVKYLVKPIELFDVEHFYSNELFYMFSIGISTRKYVQDKFIFNYGITEDVPIGKDISITAGYQHKTFANRKYIGSRISFGNYNPWGYLSSIVEFGTFFRGTQAQQGVFTAGINYFTGLLEFRRWKFRQFVKPQLTIGVNRFSNDKLTINDGFGIDGFNSPTLTGTSRLLLSTQTQSYSPWNIYGFRFGPFFTFSLGMLGNSGAKFNNSGVYSQFGLGVLIKNDHLIINTFQFSFSYYPMIPGNDINVFKMNSFHTTDFGFRDFEIGKPAVVVFQ